MKLSPLLFAALLCSPVAAEEPGSFDPGGYVQVELILFTTETDLEASNRSGVLPELLEQTRPRYFPRDLTAIEDAVLAEMLDVSWLEAEWSAIEPNLVEIEEVFDETDVSEEGAEPVVPEPVSEVPEPPAELPLWERYRIWYSDLLRDCFRQLDVSEWRLERASMALRRNPEFRVLMHAAWRQPIGRTANHVLLHGGTDEEVGVLSLRRLAFVEASVNFWRPLGEGYAELTETRPLRLGRSYYLDHPLMGAVLRVDPIQVPQEFR